MDRSTFTFNGSTISAWRDKTGNGYNTIQASAGSQPTRDTNSVVVGYSTSLQYSGSVGIHQNSYTAYIVYKCQIVETGVNLLDCRDSTTGYMFVNIQFFSWIATAAAYSRAWTPSQNTTMLGFNNTPAFIYNKSVNGSSFSPGGDGWSPNGAASYFRIGGFPGNIYECLLFKRSLTADEHIQITGYLAHKWGITDLLPTNHLYKSLTPRFSLITNNFAPTLISGCQLWLDGADPAGTGTLPANGSIISTWVDKSGNKRNGSQVSNPTYNLSRRAVYFSGSQYYTLPDSTFPAGNSSYTYLMIVNFSIINGGGVLAGGGFAGTDSTGFRNNGPGGGFYAYWFGNDIYSTTSYNPNEIVSIVSFYDSSISSRSLIQNFNVTNTGGGGRNQPPINNTVGKSYGNEYMTGYIHEILVYNKALTTTERHQVESYLAWKWGLQASLPSDHTYKSAPPSV
jgi:hypothetical protein